MARQIITGKKAREKALSGVRQLAETVAITLGPKGRNVGIDHIFVDPIVLHDGVSVAKQIELPDPFENFAAQLVKQASAKTADKAGDGTTTSTLLAHTIIEEGIKLIDEGANPMILKKGIELAINQIVAYLEEISKPITTKEEIANVATISCADREIGEKIAEAIHKVGKDGVVSVDVHAGLGIKVEYKEGMEFDKGLISTHFATDTNKVEASSENTFILITDQVLTSADEMGKFLKKYIDKTNRQEIVIIASNIDGPALDTLLLNKTRSNILPVGIFAPGFAERRKDILEDIAVLTGGTFISKDSQIKIEDVALEQLGRADMVWCDEHTTKIVGGFGDPEAIEKRAQSIRELIEKTESDFEKEKLKERLARLISGAAIIKVGARTEVELSDKKERVIDAVEATKAAVAEGIVPGGGISYLTSIKSLIIPMSQAKNKDIEKGIEIVAKALARPLEKLLQNAGVDTLTVTQKIKDSTLSFYGFNVETEEYGNMFEMGIVNPLKVDRQALQNAGSVAAMILTIEAIITDIPEKK